MSGKWTLLEKDAQSDEGKHDWAVIYLENGRKAVFSDHRRFGFMDLFETAEQDRTDSSPNLDQSLRLIT